MKRFNSISTQSLQLLVGLLIGLFVLSQSTITTSNFDREDSQEQSQSESKHSDEKATVSEAVPSNGPQVNLGFQSILLQEFIQGEPVDEKGVILGKIAITSQKALKVLSRRFIAPNAP